MTPDDAPSSERRQPSAGDTDETDVPEPVGTLFLLTIYVIVLVGMWGTMYWILLSR